MMVAQILRIRCQKQRMGTEEMRDILYLEWNSMKCIETRPKSSTPADNFEHTSQNNGRKEEPRPAPTGLESMGNWGKVRQCGYGQAKYILHVVPANKMRNIIPAARDGT